jgi:alanine dehydrogenase
LSTPIWITEAEVALVLDMGDAIAALEAGLAHEAAQIATNMVKTHVLWDGGSTLHAIGAVFSKTGMACTKTWTNTSLGSAPTLLLFDAVDGALKAVIEAMVLGQLRTGGITGVATKWLARADAGDLALIGTGKQAMTQLAAIAAVRRLRRVRVFGRDTAKRDAFVAAASRALPLAIEVASSVGAACDGADIVVLATRATQPIVTSAMLAPGAHLNAVGAITPERMEFVPDLLGRADAIVVDSVEQVRRLSREFMDYFRDDDMRWQRVRPLSATIADGKPRDAGADLTVFKAMGMGISDLSLAIEVYRHATSRGLGHQLPARRDSQARLTAAI